MNRPQPVGAVFVDPKTDHAFVIRALGGQPMELGQAHPTLTPVHPDVRSAGEPKQAGQTR